LPKIFALIELIAAAEDNRKNGAQEQYAAVVAAKK
jgi:hypothetical protein